VVNKETIMSLQILNPQSQTPQFTDLVVNKETIMSLQTKCDEFLVHAVDVEGKMSGIEGDLVQLLGQFCTIPCTVIPHTHVHIRFRLFVDISFKGLRLFVDISFKGLEIHV
jgi:hypothetical protein